MIPVIAFSAWSGTGKTTIIEKLVPELKARGLRVAVIKHDAHTFEIDREGKDSWRFAKAGADVTVISSADKTALIEQRKLEFSDVVSRIRDVDLILAEGYNQQGLPTIGISRKATGKGLRLPVTACIAVITDDEKNLLRSADAGAQPAIPVFGLTEISAIAGFIMEYYQLQQKG